MTEIAIEGLTRKAVQAALDVIDEEFPREKKGRGPLGDELAYGLHRLIEKQISKYVETGDDD